MRLLADTAHGNVIPSLAHEGGLRSTIWAGPEVIARSVKRGDHPVQGTTRKQPVKLRFGFASDEFGYAIELGLPSPSRSAFALDPEVKREYIWSGPQLRPSAMLVDRDHSVVRLRADDGGWSVVAHNLAAFDSMMDRLADPRSAPEVLTLRVDRGAADAPAAFADGFERAGDESASRPLPALARLTARASCVTQVVVVSHAVQLVSALAEQPACNLIRLEKQLGETVVAQSSLVSIAFRIVTGPAVPCSSWTLRIEVEMIRTVEAEIDEHGNVRLLEPVRLSSVHPALVTILENRNAPAAESALLSEAALGRDWNRPEEDLAWSHLQPVP